MIGERVPQSEFQVLFCFDYTSHDFVMVFVIFGDVGCDMIAAMMSFVMIIVMRVVKIMILIVRRTMIMVVRVIETFIFIAKVKVGCFHRGT